MGWCAHSYKLGGQAEQANRHGTWAAAGQMLQRLLGSHRGASGAGPTSADVRELLLTLSRDDFAFLLRTPPLLYHNDSTASVPRFYWSVDFGYALWLRLYFENAARG